MSSLVPPPVEPAAIVLFDGICNLCNHAVRFIIDRDPAGYFHFAALQSEAGVALERCYGRISMDPPDSIVLIEARRVHDRSTAALRIARRLRFPWMLLYVLIVVPRPLRDAVYRFIAKHRYRWFGRQDHCMMPSPALKQRFL